jgi:hypothetical protein
LSHHSTNQPADWQPVVADIEAWNQLFAKGLNAWTRADVDDFCAVTTRLAVVCQQLLPDAVTPLIAFKESLLTTFRVAAKQVPGPAPTEPELNSQLGICAGHLDLLRQIMTAPPPTRTRKRTTKGTSGRRGYSALALAYAPDLKHTDPAMKSQELLRRCRERFGRDAVPRNADAFRAWVSRNYRTRTN